MRGRPPKPTHLHVIQGTERSRTRKARHGEPVADGDLDSYDAPEWLDEEQLAAWRYAIDHAPAGVMKKIDRSIMVAWVVAETIHRRASVEMQSGQYVTTTPNGAEVQSAYIGIINQQAKIMKALSADLGFTPASRTRIKVIDDKKDENPFAAINGGVANKAG